MRQLTLKLSSGNKEKVLQTASDFGGRNPIIISAGEHDICIVFLPNEKVNDFLESLDQFSQPEITLIPRGVITLYPPASEAPDQVADVQPKSSLEIYLGGIQSVGSYFGLVGYSLAAGIIVWIGLVTTTSYLLVAAMLVAPFAGPAMNAALATAAGQWPLLKSSLTRYSVAITAGIVGSFLLTLVFPLKTLTPLMEEVSQVSKYALFLPLVSGFAGAINICQSERDSLVSGAAVGILVAASLAPPVGLIGMGLYMTDWPVVWSSLFRIVLQLLGIHLAATLVFYFYGQVTPSGVRFLKGKKWLGAMSTGIVTAGLIIMMLWQFNRIPFLQKASLNTALTEVLDAQLREIEDIQVLNKKVIFENVKINGIPVARFEATVVPKNDRLSKDEVQRKVVRHLKEHLDHGYENIYEVYEINVVNQ